MKKNAVALVIGFVCFITLSVLLAMTLNQPYLNAGFVLSSSDFSVTEVFKDGPADNSGLEVGDVIVNINDIDIKSFQERHYNNGVYNYFRANSALFEKGTLYRCLLADGSTHTFRIPEKASFWSRLGMLSLDDRTCFSIGFLFIILGIVLVLFCRNQFDVSSFSGFVYAAGLCIATSVTDFYNTPAYCILRLSLAQVSTAFIASNIMHIVAFSYKLAGRNKLAARHNSIAAVPFILIIVRFITVAFNPSSFFDGILFYLPYVNLVSLLYGIVMFFVLMHRIPGSSSITMRFFLTGVCFSLAPVVIILVEQLFADSFLVVPLGSSLNIFLPMLFIPVSLICGFFQTKTAKLNQLATQVMVLGCSILVLYCLMLLPVPLLFYKVIICIAAPFMCFVLEKPVLSFLFPQMDNVSGSFTDLEKLLFACDNEEEMYALAADWLITSLDASFLVFYQVPDEVQGVAGRTLYKKYPHDAKSEETLVSLIAERCADTSNADNLVIHENWGISSPIYKAHHVFGYVFIGARSQYEMFSSHEMRMIQPITRILMESLLVLDLKHQVEYINNMQNRIVYSFADMIESRDGTTGQHVKRTSLVVDLLTRYLKRHNVYDDYLQGGDYALISLAAPLHDIGKIKVPDRILSKPGKLTDEEFEIIKTHPVVGESIINKTMFKIEDERYLRIAREMALYHHEKWNGKGYPKGLKGKKIPISARIMAVADVFDALCSARSYKEAYTIDQAFEIIDESSGSHFEPVLVEAMHALRPELEKIYEKTE